MRTAQRNTAELAASFEDNKLFQGVSTAVIERVGQVCELVIFDAEEVIFDEGDPVDHFYLIASGSVRISKLGRGGRQETLSYLEADDFFGEMALFNNHTQSARAAAARETRLGRIDRTGLDRLLQLAPAEVSRNLIQDIAARLRHADSRFIRGLLEAERMSVVGQMAGMIIHDFKNPMSTILGAAGMIEEWTDDPRLSQMTGVIERSVDRMFVMVQELLDYSRGVSILDLQPVAVDDLMAELDEQALARLSRRDIHIERRVSFHGTCIMDRSKIMRMLLNLVKNAAEAMPEGGDLTVSVEARDDLLVFGVGDTGCGIPEELLPTLFEPFVTHGKLQGTGLGMAIAKSIVDAHQGTIRVESTPGVGTRFEIAIPTSLPENS